MDFVKTGTIFLYTVPLLSYSNHLMAGMISKVFDPSIGFQYCTFVESVLSLEHTRVKCAPPSPPLPVCMCGAGALDWPGLEEEVHWVSACCIIS